eukprot:TRINITY_DN9207_c0_g1_i2.p1 TRINITY_DN9207_c0_g1~~TRINITY_DN9207_c0_g1_i2.p1  ORF type:complete len:652 (+),score=78.02 TRINITY_DN9207_c0_g1_i2:39-1994(+)
MEVPSQAVYFDNVIPVKTRPTEEKWRPYQETGEVKRNYQRRSVHTSEKARKPDNERHRHLSSQNQYKSVSTKEAKKSEILGDSLQLETPTCLICCEPISFVAIGGCNHHVSCSVCTMRRRIIYKETSCVVCKFSLNPVVITGNFSAKFDNFSLSSMRQDSRVGEVYIDRPAGHHYDQIRRLWELRCMYCNATGMQDLHALKQHLQKRHSLQFCELCLKERPVFLQEQKVYTGAALKAHLRNGDQDTQISHECCQFCSEMLYDKDKLFEHLHSTHETCYICQKNGVMYQYYKDYNSLFSHFRSEHFVCERPQCLEAKFVVFRDEIALNIHEVEVHSGSTTSKKKHLNLDFQVRGSITNLPTSSDPTTSRPRRPSRSQDVRNEGKSGTDDPDLELALRLSKEEFDKTLPQLQPQREVVVQAPQRARVLEIAATAPKPPQQKDNFFELGWSTLPMEVFDLIMSYLDVKSVLRTSQVCQAFYHDSINSTVWKSFLVENLQLPFSLPVKQTDELKFFKNMRHFVCTLLSRKRICLHCNKIFVEYFSQMNGDRCVFRKPRSFESKGSWATHVYGTYQLAKPLQLISAKKPTEAFRTLRLHLQKTLFIPHTIDVGLKGSESLILRDPNTDITVKNIDDILDYLKIYTRDYWSPVRRKR